MTVDRTRDTPPRERPPYPPEPPTGISQQLPRPSVAMTRLLCLSSMKAEGSSRHGRLLVGWAGVVAADQEWSGGPVIYSGGVAHGVVRRGAAQSSRRPLHSKAMTHTERARTRPPTIVRGRGRHGSHPCRAGRSSTG